MAQGSMSVAIKNHAELIKNLKAMNKDAEKALSRTVSDFKSRAPGWVSQAVTDEYTIKKKEVKERINALRKALSKANPEKLDEKKVQDVRIAKENLESILQM